MLAATHLRAAAPLRTPRHSRVVAVRTAQVGKSLSGRVEGDKYYLSDAQKEAFVRDGFVHISGVMTEEEMAREVDPVYFKFLRGEVKVPGRDLCDTSPAAASKDEKDPEKFVMYNVMLAREYYPQWKNNLLERRCRHISEQLLSCDDIEVDFDHIEAKRPRTRDSVVSWHQDAAYWPEELEDEHCLGTANCFVAVSDVPVEAGCMRYVPGSHKEGLRKHKPASSNPNPNAPVTLKTAVGGERAELVPLKRGDVVVHTERVVHGSGPNMTDGWRYGYVLNFKRELCVVDERSLGFTNPYTGNVKGSSSAFYANGDSK